MTSNTPRVFTSTASPATVPASRARNVCSMLGAVMILVPLGCAAIVLAGIVATSPVLIVAAASANLIAALTC
ncbi:hypothetical protein ABMA10_00100 [Plantibacter sp. RU18]